MHKIVSFSYVSVIPKNICAKFFAPPPPNPKKFNTVLLKPITQLHFTIRGDFHYYLFQGPTIKFGIWDDSQKSSDDTRNGVCSEQWTK